MTQCDVIKKRYQKALEKLKGTVCGWIIAGDRFRNKKHEISAVIGAARVHVSDGIDSRCARNEISVFWHGYINTQHSFYGCEWKPLMGDSLFNYKARHTQTLLRPSLAVCLLPLLLLLSSSSSLSWSMLVYTEQLDTEPSFRTEKLKIPLFNLINLISHFGEVAKLPLATSYPSFYWLRCVLLTFSWEWESMGWLKSVQGWITIQHKTPFGSPEDTTARAGNVGKLLLCN